MSFLFDLIVAILCATGVVAILVFINHTKEENAKKKKKRVKNAEEAMYFLNTFGPMLSDSQSEALHGILNTSDSDYSTRFNKYDLDRIEEETLSVQDEASRRKTDPDYSCIASIDFHADYRMKSDRLTIGDYVVMLRVDDVIVTARQAQIIQRIYVRGLRQKTIEFCAGATIHIGELPNYVLTDENLSALPKPAILRLSKHQYGDFIDR